MKAIKVLLMTATLLVGTLCLVRCSDSGTDSNGQKDFEVREWGVLIGCATDSSYFLTSRPEVSQLVKLPVIYVHSRSKTPFTAKAAFATGGPSDAYPPADMGQRTVEWRNVTFPSISAPYKPLSGSDYEPLEHIIPALNNVDADILEYNGWLSRFLFYEGAVQFRNQIAASYDLDSLTAYVTNQGNFTVYNVNLIIRMPNSYGPTPRAFFVHWDQLEPLQTKDALLAEEPVYSYVADMKAQGFSQMEAESFAGLWEQTFCLANSTTELSNLIYRLPQSVYDSIITLSVTPAPDKLVRTLYVLIHSQELAPDTGVVGKLTDIWEWVQSQGGFVGRTITPETEGYTRTLYFNRDWSFIEERNDTTFLESTFRLFTRTRGNFTYDVVQIGDFIPMRITSISDSTLELMDECSDCYSHIFRRLPTWLNP
jgi:hypothetical protein